MPTVASKQRPLCSAFDDAGTEAIAASWKHGNPDAAADETAYIAAGTSPTVRGRPHCGQCWPSPGASTSRNRRCRRRVVFGRGTQRRPPLARRYARGRLDERRLGRHDGARLEQTSAGLSQAGSARRGIALALPHSRPMLVAGREATGGTNMTSLRTVSQRGIVGACGNAAGRNGRRPGGAFRDQGQAGLHDRRRDRHGAVFQGCRQADPAGLAGQADDDGSRFQRHQDRAPALDDTFVVSENAWRTGGAPSGASTMFAKLKSAIRAGGSDPGRRRAVGQ